MNLYSSAQQDLDSSSQDFSISPLEIKKYRHDHYFPHNPTALNHLKKTKIRILKQKVQPHPKNMDRMKQTRPSWFQIDKKLKIHQFNEKCNKVDQWSKSVRIDPRLFISTITDLHFSGEHCFVCTQLPTVFSLHPCNDKHISTMSRKKTSANCMFCRKKVFSVHHFKNHLKDATNFKDLVVLLLNKMFLQ